MNPMREIIEIPKLEAVCGGLLNFSPLSPVTQITPPSRLLLG
jgi:hypothetical protein